MFCTPGKIPEPSPAARDCTLNSTEVELLAYRMWSFVTRHDRLTGVFSPVRRGIGLGVKKALVRERHREFFNLNPVPLFKPT
jgi:hypothetical protein